MCLVYRKIRHVPRDNNGGRQFAFAPCGKCEDCLNHARYAWAWRLTSDIQYYVKEKGYRVGFVTLTYNDAHLPRFSPWLDDECVEESPLANIPCFSKDDTQKLILYLRKVLHKKTGMTDLVYFLASEFGPSTRRPHYHMIIAWPSQCEKQVEVNGKTITYGYSVSAEEMHALIRHYWVECKQAGFISPDTPQGGKSKRSGKKYLPFEVASLNDCLQSCFYTAKYVTKDIYFMDELRAEVENYADSRVAELSDALEQHLWSNGGVDDAICERLRARIDYWRFTCFNDIFKRASVKDCLPHHRQKKSLGFESIRSLSDRQKIDLLNRGMYLLGNDKLSMPPMYIRNKIMFKPCYWNDKSGRRLVKQECTEFTRLYFGEIMTNKIGYFDSLFDSMKDTQFWTTSGLPGDYASRASALVLSAPNFGMKLSEAYYYYYGVEAQHCYKDKRFTFLNRYKFPCLVAQHMAHLDSDVWRLIQSFFTELLEYCKWRLPAEHDYEADYLRDYYNQPAELIA